LWSTFWDVKISPAGHGINRNLCNPRLINVLTRIQYLSLPSSRCNHSMSLKLTFLILYSSIRLAVPVVFFLQCSVRNLYIHFPLTDIQIVITYLINMICSRHMMLNNMNSRICDETSYTCWFCCCLLREIIIIIIIITAIGLSPGGSGYFTCTQIWKK